MISSRQFNRRETVCVCVCGVMTSCLLCFTTTPENKPANTTFSDKSVTQVECYFTLLYFYQSVHAEPEAAYVTFTLQSAVHHNHLPESSVCVQCCLFVEHTATDRCLRLCFIICQHETTGYVYQDVRRIWQSLERLCHSLYFHLMLGHDCYQDGCHAGDHWSR